MDYILCNWPIGYRSSIVPVPKIDCYKFVFLLYAVYGGAE